MKNETTKKKLNIVLIISIFIVVAVAIYASLKDKTNDEIVKQPENIYSEKPEAKDETKVVAETYPKEDPNRDEVADGEVVSEEIKEIKLVKFSLEDAFSYCYNPVCRYSKEDNKLRFNFTFKKGVPKSDNNYVYLFEFSNFENEEITEEKKPFATIMKSEEINIVFDYEPKYMFSRFVPAILSDGEFIFLSNGQYLTNPEEIADNTEPIPEIESKKGLLLDANTIDTEYLYDLDVERLVFNIPLSYIMGESESPECPTIEYKYNGRTYYFNGYRVAGFDSLFEYLTNKGYYSTAIILNDWNKKYPEMIHPKSRRRTGRSMYYAFNTEEEEGVRMMEATALFLAQRYSGAEHGMVHEWVIANEINQKSIWNYMATDDLNYYTESFEKSFRTFYNAIKSNYKNAKVYFSIDHDWNNNGGRNGWFFNGKELLYSFNDYAKMRGDYDWGLSIHPYPAPLTKVTFWKGEYDKTEDAKVVTPMNLSSLTDVMVKDEFLDTKGQVRDIAVTELGFSSRAGEKLQAAAFAYCYYIIEDNEYINSFLLNRQTDDTESLKSGLALGIYNNDYSSKYLAEVFKNIDSEKGNDYIEEMLEIIGSETLEDALLKAR